MPLTKVTKSGITNNAIDADKLEDGTILAADITPGTITADKLDSTLNLSSKTVTLPNTSVTNAMLAGSIANAKLANSSITVNGTSVSLGSSISAGALDWQAVQTTGFTAVAGRGYFCNTTSAAFTVTLPASATAGDTIALVDYAGTFGTNKLTIGRNGHNIQGVANNSQIGTNRASVTLVYADVTKGWVYQNESNVADLGQPLFISATGGTVLTDGNFKIHVFTGDGCFAVSQLGNGPTVPTGGPTNVDYLVVAGGGGGGNGGGGAGGYRTTFPSPGCNAGSFPITATTYPITIGAGAGQTKGTPSVFSSVTATGGGNGGHYAYPLSCQPQGSGSPGGSGGGAVQHPGGPTNGIIGSGNTPPTSPSQGNNGGPGGPGSPIFTSGSGGGAGAAGNAGSSSGAAGGIGTSIADTFFGPTAPSYGTPGPAPGRYFAGGGGSTSFPGTGPNTSIAGGGGAAGPGQQAATAGAVNTGGGGAGSTQTHAAGGSGIVVIRYKFQ